MLNAQLQEETKYTMLNNFIFVYIYLFNYRNAATSRPIWDMNTHRVFYKNFCHPLSQICDKHVTMFLKIFQIYFSAECARNLRAPMLRRHKRSVGHNAIITHNKLKELGRIWLTRVNKCFIKTWWWITMNHEDKKNNEDAQSSDPKPICPVRENKKCIGGHPYTIICCV